MIDHCSKSFWLTLTTYLNFSRQLHVIKLLNAAVVVVDGRNEGLEAAMVFIYATRSYEEGLPLLGTTTLIKPFHTHTSKKFWHNSSWFWGATTS